MDKRLMVAGLSLIVGLNSGFLGVVSASETLTYLDKNSRDWIKSTPAGSYQLFKKDFPAEKASFTFLLMMNDGGTHPNTFSPNKKKLNYKKMRNWLLGLGASYLALRVGIRGAREIHAIRNLSFGRSTLSLYVKNNPAGQAVINLWEARGKNALTLATVAAGVDIARDYFYKNFNIETELELIRKKTASDRIPIIWVEPRYFETALSDIEALQYEGLELNNALRGF